MKTIKLLLSLLALFVFGEVAAQDYVDAINQSSKASAGHRVIYEMNVGAFTQQGTFAAAQQRLSELKTLGVDIVWLMPIYPRGGGLNSPYAATNFQQVNPSYGSIADLRNFVSRAHELNMLVWLDWVPNHTATNASWVSQHPDYYTWSNGQMVHPNGYGDVYELNYGNQSLQNAMTDCLKFWVDQANVDGYRCDYVASPTIPNTYWQNAIGQLSNYRNKKIEFLAESNLTWDHYLDNVNVGFSYDYAWSFQTDLVNIGNGTSASALQNAANTLINASKYNFARMLYITNHDQNYNENNKTLSAKYGDNKYLLTVFYYTLYGMPLIYNGQEIGGDQALNYFTDEKVNWNNTDYKMRNTVRTLNALKHNEAALGDKVGVNWLNTNNGNVLAYTRKDGSSEVLVILNLGNGQNTVSISGLNAGTWSQWLNSSNIASGVSRTQQNIGSTQSFTIPAKGYQVFVRDGNSSGNSTGGNASSGVYTPFLDNASEVSVFFETKNQTSYSVWVWGEQGGGEAYCSNTSWPGDGMELKGRSSSGGYIYKRTFTRTSSVPSNIIISKDNGNTKIYDGIVFVNHGYYVEGTNNSSWTVTQMGNQQVKAPVITPYVNNGSGWKQGTSLTVNAGGYFVIGPQADQSGSWSWTGPNGFTSNSREFTRSNVTTSQAGTYTVTFTAQSGATAKQSFTVNVNAAPKITPYVNNGSGWKQGTSLTVNAGGYFVIGPQADQSGSWSWTGPNGFTSNSREFTRSNVTTSQAGTYTVTFTAQSGATAKQSFSVNVINNTPKVTIYVKTNHNGFNIWAWNGGTNLVEGSWPGPRLSSAGNNGWYSYTFSSDKVSFKLNDNGAQQSGELYDITSDSYYYYIDGALIKAGDIVHNSGEKVVFFCNLNGDDYSAVSCYAWGNGGESLGSWPGRGATQCGTAYLYDNGTYTRRIWRLPVPNTPEGANLIFNNNGGGWQMNDVYCTYGNLYIGGGSAYAASRDAMLSVETEDETTGINNVQARADNAQWYTLSGVKVDKPTKRGIYIVNGRKVVVGK